MASKKKLSPEDAEAKIRKAAAEGKIVYAPSDDIEDYEDIAREFLMGMFDVDYDECFISDESRLSDFAGCCFPEDVESKGMPWEEFYKVARAAMVTKIEETYGLTVDPHDELVAVFERIRQKKIALVN